MSLREEMWKYEQITGESAEHVPIIKLGAFLDGYEMGLKALEQTELKSCEDCISRKDTIEWLKKVTVTEGIEFQTGFEQILYDIEQMPPVTLQIEPCEDAISRQAVLDEKYTHTYPDGFVEEYVTVKDILELPPVTQQIESCDDCIDREEVIKLLEKEDWADTVTGVLALPSVTPQPKTGHWIEGFNDLEGEVRFTCSSCGEYQLFETDYCPNCGAKMVESQESEVEE